MKSRKGILFEQTADNVTVTRVTLHYDGAYEADEGSAKTEKLGVEEWFPPYIKQRLMILKLANEGAVVKNIGIRLRALGNAYVFRCIILVDPPC
jgi:hypothetical protein